MTSSSWFKQGILCFINISILWCFYYEAVIINCFIIEFLSKCTLTINCWYSFKNFWFSYRCIIFMHETGILQNRHIILFLNQSSLIWRQNLCTCKHRKWLVKAYCLSSSALPFWKASFLHDLFTVSLEIHCLAYAIFVCFYEVYYWKVFFILWILRRNAYLFTIEMSRNVTCIVKSEFSHLISFPTIRICFWKHKIRPCWTNTRSQCLQVFVFEWSSGW